MEKLPMNESLLLYALQEPSAKEARALEPEQYWGGHWEAGQEEGTWEQAAEAEETQDVGNVEEFQGQKSSTLYCFSGNKAALDKEEKKKTEKTIKRKK